MYSKRATGALAFLIHQLNLVWKYFIDCCILHYCESSLSVFLIFVLYYRSIELYLLVCNIFAGSIYKQYEADGNITIESVDNSNLGSPLKCPCIPLIWITERLTRWLFRSTGSRGPTRSGSLVLTNYILLRPVMGLRWLLTVP